MNPVDTRPTTGEIEDGLSEMTSAGIVLNWRRSRTGRGRAYRIEFPSGERVTWEVGKVLTFLRGARKGRAV